MPLKWLRYWLGTRPATQINTARRQVELPGIGWVTVVRSLDCLGTGCPRPQLLTVKVMEEITEGDIIELLSDNPSSVETLPALMLTICGTHLATVREQELWRVYLQKGLREPLTPKHTQERERHEYRHPGV